MGQAQKDRASLSRQAAGIQGQGIPSSLRAAQDDAGERDAHGESARCVETSSSQGATITRRAPQDLRLPRMVYAAIGALEQSGSEAAEQAIQELRAAPGVVGVLCYPASNIEGVPACDGGVAVVARGYWLARQLLARLMDQCGARARALLPDSAAGDALAETGSLTKLTASSSPCTVQFYNGQLRIWMSSANPRAVCDAAARIAALPAESIDLRLTGACDSAHGLAALVPAIALARELHSTPVQVIVAYELEMRSLAAASQGEPRARREGQLRVVARAA
jgi:hypothetical protein